MLDAPPRRTYLPAPLPRTRHVEHLPDPAHPVRCRRRGLRRADTARRAAGSGTWRRLRGVERLSGAQDRAHRQRLDSDRRSRGGVLPHAGSLDDPGEQHRADDRVGRRVDRGRRRLHAPGDSPDGLRPDRGEGGHYRPGGRRAGRAADDSAAPGAHREGARPAHLSGGDGVRRGAHCRGARRLAGQAPLSGVRGSVRLQIPDGGAQGLEGVPGQGFDFLPRRVDQHRSLAGADGGRLHHRAPDCRVSLCRRIARLPGAHSGHQTLRQRPHPADLRRIEADH